MCVHVNQVCDSYHQFRVMDGSKSSVPHQLYMREKRPYMHLLQKITQLLGERAFPDSDDNIVITCGCLGHLRRPRLRRAQSSSSRSKSLFSPPTCVMQVLYSPFQFI